MTLLQFILYPLIAMMVHEGGHLAAAYFYGIRVRKIGCNWRGLYIQRACSVGWPEVVTCLAGAGMNLLLALAFQNFHWFAICNLIFAVVNLLPIPHSDGSHAFAALRLSRSPYREVVD